MNTQTFPWPVETMVLAQRGGTPESGTTQTQADGGNGAGGEGPPPGGGELGGIIWMLLLGMIVFVIFTSISSGRKQKKQRAELMGSLKKHDRVQTVGGVIGTIAEMHDDEVILRVDDSSNTRIRFSKSAVQQVLKPGPDGAGEAPSEPALSQPQQVRGGGAAMGGGGGH